MIHNDADSIKKIFVLLACRPDFFADPIGNRILAGLRSEEKFPEKEILRDIFHHYTRSHGFKLPDLWHYYLFNRFTLSKLPEHEAFYRGNEIPVYLFEEYKKEVIAPLKNAFLSLKAPVAPILSPEIPYSEERQKLHQAFMIQDIEDICSLARDFFYQTGPGPLSYYYYFEWQHGLNGIGTYRKKFLDELVGYEAQKEIVRENTERFLDGLESNNVFLYGSRGTGKTSLIQALLEEYKHRGLRIIKIWREDIEDLPKVSRLLKNRKEKFLINLDDISYEEEEVIYKKHKAAIDFFFDREPKNILLYATSNSQEIVKFFRQETTDTIILDNRIQEEKKLEPLQRQIYDERRAFTERFGLHVFFGRTEPQTAEKIIDFYRRKYQLSLTVEELMKEYYRWIRYHGAVNGRTIENFFKYLHGR